jgi:hypothetical protein
VTINNSQACAVGSKTAAPSKRRVQRGGVSSDDQ